MSQFIEVTMIRCKSTRKLERFGAAALEPEDLQECKVLISARATLTVMETYDVGLRFPGEGCRLALPVGEIPVTEPYEKVKAMLLAAW